MRFADRDRAGEELAAAVVEALADDAPEAVVLALPRGGVPVAAHVARAVGAPLDVLLVRKLGTPRNPELAMGAVASGGVRVLNDGLVRQLGVPADWIEREVEAQTRELERRGRRYRGDAPPAEVAGRTVVLVDDGIATGASMLAAVRAVRSNQPTKVVVAVPVGPESACRELAAEADDVVCATMPPGFEAVGQVFEDFHQVSDDEVREVLAAG